MGLMQQYNCVASSVSHEVELFSEVSIAWLAVNPRHRRSRSGVRT